MNQHTNRKVFQGSNKNKGKRYFEGWYYKQTTKDGLSISFIPGVSYNNLDPHAFVQCIYNSPSGELIARYFRYDLEAFHYSDHPFLISIGDNRFSEVLAEVYLVDSDTIIEGRIELGTFERIDESLFCPNIMGFFSYIPNMECNHDVVSMHHSLKGTIQFNDQELSFDSGVGYIEKDWGISFPQEYIWIQCNDFKNSEVRLVCSIATIPMKIFRFKGFFCAIIVEGVEYRFATYNGATIKKQKTGKGLVELVLKRKGYKLWLKAMVSELKELRAPLKGQMTEVIKEGLAGRVMVQLIDCNGETIYKGTGEHAGIEIEMVD